mmetsp:Transcript_44103/g.93901  ORF Transcript_44103/g.93901 Transcript_44103/m.93901 type:complete len:651 (+) Transcript_44103:116-2068(+)
MTVEEAVTVTEEARPTSRSCLRSAGSSRSSRPISRGHSRNSSRCQSRGSLKPQDASSTAKEASELEASTTFNESRILGESATLYETSRMGASAVSFALPVEEAKAQGNDRPEDRSARHAALVSEALVRAKQQDAARATMLELVRSLDESSGRRRELEAQLQKEQHSAEALRDNLRRLAEQLWAAEQREEDLKVAAWRARLIESTTQGSSRVLGSVLLMSHALAPLELLATEIQEEEEEEGSETGMDSDEDTRDLPVPRHRPTVLREQGLFFSCKRASTTFGTPVPVSACSVSDTGSCPKPAETKRIGNLVPGDSSTLAWHLRAWCEQVKKDRLTKQPEPVVIEKQVVVDNSEELAAAAAALAASEAARQRAEAETERQRQLLAQALAEAERFRKETATAAEQLQSERAASRGVDAKLLALTQQLAQKEKELRLVEDQRNGLLSKAEEDAAKHRVAVERLQAQVAQSQAQIAERQRLLEASQQAIKDAEASFKLAFARADAEKQQLKMRVRETAAELQQAVVLAKHMRDQLLREKRAAKSCISPDRFAELVAELERVRERLAGLARMSDAEKEQVAMLQSKLAKQHHAFTLEKQFLPLLHQVNGAVGPHINKEKMIMKASMSSPTLPQAVPARRPASQAESTSSSLSLPIV